MAQGIKRSESQEHDVTLLNSFAYSLTKNQVNIKLIGAVAIEADQVMGIRIQW